MSFEVDTSRYELNNEKVRANGGWITNEFLQEVISTHDGDADIRVVDRVVTAAVGAGDNYLSIIYQMTAELVNDRTGQKEIRRLLIKGLPSAKILKDMALEYGVFRKELYLYNVCLPGMRRIMEIYMPEEENFIAAKPYKCSLQNVVVLEDLKLSGYRMAHRREQLDFAHTAVTLRSLARFHLLSKRLVHDQPEVIDEVSRGEFYSEEKKERLNVYLPKAVKSWLKIMKEQEKTAGIVPMMEKITEQLLEKVIFVVNKREGSFLTINHGDSWTNNFMYKYDEDGNVIHAKIVDFQLSRYSSPVLDILYFLFSSSQPDMLLEKFEELIEIYHDALISDMERLQLDLTEAPSLETIHREMRERSILAVVSIIVITPVVVAKPSEVTDFEDIDVEVAEKSEDYLLENNFRDPLYHDIVVKYVTIFEKMGYIKSAGEQNYFPNKENN